MWSSLAMTDCMSVNYHCVTLSLRWDYYLCRMHLLSHLALSSLQSCVAVPSSMPLAYRRTSWPWILREEINTLKKTNLCYYVLISCKPNMIKGWLCTTVVAHLQRISVKGRISPSQFHTDTGGDLLQHRPHRMGVAIFCSFIMSRPARLSVRCCWELLLLTVSTYPLPSSSVPPLWPAVSSYASSSLPDGREKRTAFTRWTSTKGRSN